MFGAIAKSFGAESLKIKPESMCVISFMPCTAKKSEAERPEMNGASLFWQGRRNNIQGEIYKDVDLVLTTRELSRLLKMAGIDLAKMPAEKADSLLGKYTGAAPIFGRTGGVMEAALRTAITLLTDQPPSKLEFNELESWDGIKEASFNLVIKPSKWQ
jgi:iron only hydrogenase large subunit-like protein